jgi:hypothetical protein
MWEIHHNALNQFNDVFCVVPHPEWPVAKGTLTAHGIMFLDSECLRDDPPHTLARALARSVAHTSYHVGQIVQAARILASRAGTPWSTLTIPRGGSASFNASLNHNPHPHLPRNADAPDRIP